MEVFSARSFLFKQVFKMCNANSSASHSAPARLYTGSSLI